jgi:hypothetical protein
MPRSVPHGIEAVVNPRVGPASATCFWQSTLTRVVRSARSGVCQFDQDIGVARFGELAGTR